MVSMAPALLVSFSFKVLFPLCGRWPIISADNPAVYSVNKHVRVAGISEDYTLGRKVVREKWTESEALRTTVKF